MKTPRMLRLPGAGIELQAADWSGQGEPILAVHGMTANCRSFDLVARALAPTHRFLAVDLRGRGLSDKPDTGYSVDLHCQDLESALTELGLSRVTLMGHSLGAYICLALAGRRPDLARGLILLDGGAPLSQAQWDRIELGIKASFARLGKPFPSFEDYIAPFKAAPFLQPWSKFLEDYFRYESVEREGEIWSRTDPDHIAQDVAGLRVLDPTGLYPKVACPVLILRATEGLVSPEDLVLPEQPTQEMIQALDRAEKVDLAGTNHYSIALQPNPERDRVILEFLAEL